MWNVVNVNIERRCAICEYWDDPCRSALKLKDPKHGYWLYDTTQEAICYKVNDKRKSTTACPYFKCKFK